VAAAIPAVELRNVEMASLLGARIVILDVLARAETMVGFAASRPGWC
jgi:hypothetical protein